MIAHRAGRKYKMTCEYLPNHTNQIKNTDSYSYVVGLFLVVQLEIEDITSFFSQYGCENLDDSINSIYGQLIDGNDD